MTTRLPDCKFTRAEAAEVIALKCVATLSQPDVMGLEFLWACGKAGTTEELAKLKDAIRSAVISELEEFKV